MDLYSDNYESPIKLIQQELTTSMENDIFKAIQSYGITVDKDELIKALNYDRDQYDKGFKDGYSNNITKLKESIYNSIVNKLDEAESDLGILFCKPLVIGVLNEVLLSDEENPQK